MKLKSMRLRLALGFTLAIGIATVLGCVLLARYARATLRQEADALLGRALKRLHTEQEEAGQGLAALRAAERQVDEPSVVFVVLDARGRILQSSSRHFANVLGGILRSPSTQLKLPQTGVPAFVGNTSRFRVKTDRFGPYTVMAALSWSSNERVTERQERLLGLLALLVWTCAGAGAWLLVGRALSPISAFISEVHRFPVHVPIAAASGASSNQSGAAGGVEAKVPMLRPSSDDHEIVQLVDTLNGLLARLAAASAARGRFYAAASHELRTPLQALSGHLELALSRPRSAEEYRELVGEALGQTRRLTGLVRDLLALHRVESGEAPPRSRLDLGQVTRMVLDALSETIAQRHLRLECVFADSVWIDASPNYFEMVARNLLDNAVRYTPEGGDVRVTLQASPPALVVENSLFARPAASATVSESARASTEQTSETGAPSDESLVSDAGRFEPFARRSRGSGGNGLGLSISRAVAEASGWNLSLQGQGGCVRARLEFATPH